MRPPTLTRRQDEVARLMALRYSNKEIAVVLGLSVHTVKRHVEIVLLKVGIHSRRDLDLPTRGQTHNGPRSL